MNRIPAPHLLTWPPLLEQLQPLFAGAPIYLVGGAVRDAYLRRPVHDLDFVVDGDGRKWARKVANALGGAYYPLDDERGVGRAIVEADGERFMIDIARQRGDSLLDDLAARDFTMNAMAVPMDGTGDYALQEIIDPLNGIRDLSQKRLRRCSPDSIPGDPIRALRAIRQSVALNLNIEPETRHDIRLAHFDVTSIERVRDEFMTILGGKKPHVALRVLDTLGLLTQILPEIETMRGVAQSPPHAYDVWEHTLNVVERLDGILTTISPSRNMDTAAEAGYGMIVFMLDRFRHLLQDHLSEPMPNGRTTQSMLVLAALLHDCGKPATRSQGDDGRYHFYKHEIIGAEMAQQRTTALRLSNEEVSRITAIVRHHMRPMNLNMSGETSPSRRSIYRFWNGTEGAGIDICILTLADFLGMVGTNLIVDDWIHFVDMVGTLLDGYFNQREIVVSPPPLLNGNDLIRELTLAPGPEIGRLLKLISEAQAVGEITTLEEALKLAQDAHNNTHSEETE